MRIEVLGDDSISRQACTYAEYRLFAALSRAVDTSRVKNATVVLHRGKAGRRCDSVLCSVTIELDDGDVTRLLASGDHPYAAINSAVERLRLPAGREPEESAVS